MNATTNNAPAGDASAAVTVRLNAALVRELRRASGMEADPFETPPRDPRRRFFEQSQRNRIAVEIAIRAYLKLKGGA